MSKHVLLALVVASLLLSACVAPAPPAAPTLEAPATPEATATQLAPAATDAATATPEASAPQAPAALPDDAVAQLDEFLKAQVYTEGAAPQSHTPGLVLLVDTPDGRYLQAAGVASLEKGTPMQVDSRLEIGSNSKSFTDVLLLQLQEEGVLSLDDPLSKWLPDWAAKIPNGDKITLRQLAQHTAGIWDYGDPIIGDAVNDPAKLAQGYTPAELVQYAIDNGTPDFAPGEEGKWKYSNTGYILLGIILEKATGQTLGELYKARIFESLGLKTAALIEGVPAAGEITDGYWWTEDGKINNTTNWNVSQGWAAGGIAMTAEELLTYVKALAAGILPNQTRSDRYYQVSCGQWNRSETRKREYFLLHGCPLQNDRYPRDIHCRERRGVPGRIHRHPSHQGRSGGMPYCTGIIAGALPHAGNRTGTL